MTYAPRVLTPGQVLVGNASQVLLVRDGLQVVAAVWAEVASATQGQWPWLAVVWAELASAWLRVWAELACATQA